MKNKVRIEKAEQEAKAQKLHRGGLLIHWLGRQANEWTQNGKPLSSEDAARLAAAGATVIAVKYAEPHEAEVTE